MAQCAGGEITPEQAVYLSRLDLRAADALLQKNPALAESFARACSMAPRPQPTPAAGVRSNLGAPQNWGGVRHADAAGGSTGHRHAHSMSSFSMV